MEIVEQLEKKPTSQPIHAPPVRTNFKFVSETKTCFGCEGGVYEPDL